MKLAEKKRINAILFFATKTNTNEIHRMRLMKLLWLADRIHLNKYGRTILEDKHIALKHGPILSKTMDLSEESIENKTHVKHYTITAEDNFDSVYFSESDLEVMEEVWETYGRMKESRLRNLSHKFPEWKRFEKKLEDDTKPPHAFEIHMEDLFEGPQKEVENYNHNEELSKLSKEEYFEHKRIEEILS